MLEDEQKEEKQYQLKMIKLESLKKSDHFKQVLKGKKIHTDFFSLFATKSFLKANKNNLLISFITKKKIGNAVKRNRIRRRLKAMKGKENPLRISLGPSSKIHVETPPCAIRGAPPAPPLPNLSSNCPLAEKKLVIGKIC